MVPAFCMDGRWPRVPSVAFLICSLVQILRQVGFLPQVLTHSTRSHLSRVLQEGHVR
jgi:hypothetical protein